MTTNETQAPQPGVPTTGAYVWLTEHYDMHPRTAQLVTRFAKALAEKLAAAEKKYGYSDGWADPGWMDECRTRLIEHLGKGDPRDVAAYCAFLWHHGESTAAPVYATPSQAEGDDMLEPLIYAAIMHSGRPKTIGDFEQAAANVADMLKRRAQPQPKGLPPIGEPWQAIDDDALASIEAWAMVDRKVIIPIDAYNLRNMLAHMVREVRATRAAAVQAPAPAAGLVPRGFLLQWPTANGRQPVWSDTDSAAKAIGCPVVALFALDSQAPAVEALSDEELERVSHDRNTGGPGEFWAFVHGARYAEERHGIAAASQPPVQPLGAEKQP